MLNIHIAEVLFWVLVIALLAFDNQTTAGIDIGIGSVTANTLDITCISELM